MFNIYKQQLKITIMKHILVTILFLILCYVSITVFNEYWAWGGIFLGALTLGGFIYYIYKQLKINDNEKKF